MKTDKEFKNEVYARASKERARIKKRNRVIMTAVPCFVIALTAATAAVYHSTSFSMKDAMPAEQPINAENYVQTEGIPGGYKSAPLTSEDQECYQQPDIATDISSGSVKSGSSVVPTENHGAAVTTVDGDKKGDFNRLNCDFRAFPDKKGEKKQRHARCDSNKQPRKARGISRSAGEIRNIERRTEIRAFGQGR